MNTLTIANQHDLTVALKDGNLKFDGAIEFKIDIPAGWIVGNINAKDINAKTSMH